MSADTVEVNRPERWDHPLDPAMEQPMVRWLESVYPFSEMDRSRFSHNTTISDIIRNDCRFHVLAPGDVIFSEGQYGESAYLVLNGQVRIFLDRLKQGEPSKRRGRGGIRQRVTRWLATAGSTVFAQDRRRRRRSHTARRVNDNVQFCVRGQGAAARVFLQDIPGVLARNATSIVEAGELFGEIAAVTRTPREFTAVSEGESVVLEIRWQGLKLFKQDPAFRRLLDERYRSGVLRTHLRETPLLRYIPDEDLQKVVESTRFEQFGDLEWYATYRKQLKQDAAARIESEPLIAEEGSYATGLWVIRSGFARLSQRQGVGHRTLAYLGKGQVFGLAELVQNVSSPDTPPLPYQKSLRAIGYVDALCIPKQVFQNHILPCIRSTELPARIESPRYQFGQPVIDPPLHSHSRDVEVGLLEFLVDQRLMNGREAMVIDLDRCTRCDDCVRACGTAHGSEPLFVREGPQYGSWKFAQACMHCEDPVCMIGCPTGAIHRDNQSGLVQITDETCIGCKICAESCPYQNIRMVESRDERGRVRLDYETRRPILRASKCDLCKDNGGQPACQSACPHDALVRLDLTDVKNLAAHVKRKGL